jgi:ketosteroid isomerase-like protein
MSSANIDLLRSIFAAWERGDFGNIEWAIPEIEFGFADGPEPGTWTGLDGIAKANREWLSAWEKVRIKAESYTELDNERVFVVTLGSGRGRTSGLEVAPMARSAFLFDVRDGRVTRIVAYWDRDRALADLGLVPGTGT